MSSPTPAAELAPAAPATPEVAPPPPTLAQKLFALPVLGGWLATGFGVLLPLILFFACLPASLEDSRFEMAMAAAVVLVWNLVFTRLLKVRITTPLIPIPLSFVAFLFLVIGLWDGFSR
jgi:hypothetical protein